MRVCVLVLLGLGLELVARCLEALVDAGLVAWGVGGRVCVCVPALG